MNVSARTRKRIEAKIKQDVIKRSTGKRTESSKEEKENEHIKAQKKRDK